MSVTLNFYSVSSHWDQQGRQAAWERNQVSLIFFGILLHYSCGICICIFVLCSRH